jgi:steroid delta-isomerase
MPSTEHVRAAVDAYVEAYGKNDRDAFLDAFADDGVIIDPVGTPPHEGREARGAFWDTVHQMTGRISFEVHDVVVCGNEAAMVFTINAGSGEGGGVTMDVVDIFEIDDDGKITLMKAYWDMSRATPVM